MMTKSNAVVAIYKTHADAEAAVKELRHSGFDMKKLSIVGRDHHTGEHMLGYYNSGGRMTCWGKKGAFRGGIRGSLFGSAFLLVPGMGPLFVAGPFVDRIIGALEGTVVVGGLSAIGAGLYSLGIPENSILKYETALKTGKFVLIAHGAAEGATSRNHTRQIMNEKVNTLTPWNQLNGMNAFQHGFESLLRRSLVNLTGDHERAVKRVPLVDICEDDKEYLIKAELPEVKKEDVKITIDDSGTLTITGDRKFALNRKKDHRVKHAHGSFLYSFLLPDDARPAKVSREFKDGVLTVHLVKDQKAKPQLVEVKVA